MPLTEPSTVIGAVTLAVTMISGTVLMWRRWPRRGRLALRTVTLLLSQIMVLLVSGLLVNCAQELYPTLETLIDPPTTTWSPPEATGAGNLDQWLAARSEHGARTGLTFAWQPTGDTRWPLAESPTVRLPPQYFEHTGSRFPVVIAITEPKDIALADLRRADRNSEPAVIVLVRPTNTTVDTMTLLGADLPQKLERDLRIFSDRWGTVGIGAYAKVA
nr:hypothetical protein [Longispora sp. (in: high G+C Gram-positive bacteria)]